MQTLNPDDTFTVQEYRYVTFTFGTDAAARRRYNSPAGPAGTPWAFRNAAILSSTPIERAPIAAHLHLGDLIEVPEYGVWRIERDHNQNVKFVRGEAQS